jgi:hypothetical protein
MNEEDDIPTTPCRYCPEPALFTGWLKTTPQFPHLPIQADVCANHKDCVFFFPVPSAGLKQEGVVAP